MGITQILDLHPSKNMTMEEMTAETPRTVRSRGEHPSNPLGLVTMRGTSASPTPSLIFQNIQKY